ncbi:MAG: extracellular solute-binding protein [Chloroflexi bacterium]|nr:extracellular solute-binding protein [Chloroflexota bacterium]
MSSKLTRREFLRDSGFLAAAVALVSCTPTPGPEPTSPPAEGAATSAPEVAEPTEVPAAPPADEPVALRLTYWDAWSQEQYEKEVETYRETHPNVTVAIEMTSYGEYSPKLTAAMAGGVPPDIIAVINAFVTVLGANGSLLPLQPYVEGDNFDLSDYLEGNLKEGSWMGDLLAIPMTADAVWWFYLKDVFEEEGLETPYELWKDGRWNWDTYLDLAAKLTKGEGMDKQWGTENLTPNNDFWFNPQVWANGGNLYDCEYTKCLLNEEEAVQAFEFYYAAREYAPGPEDAEAGSMQSGRVMMFGTFEQRNTLFMGQVPFEWSCAPPPASPNTGEIMFCGDCVGWSMPTIGKHPDQAWEFMKFLQTPESLMRLFYAVASPPPRVSMFDTPAIFEEHPNYGLDPQIAWEITQARMANFRNMPKMSNYAETRTAMSETMSLVWVDTMDLHEGIEKVTQDWDDLLQDAVIDPDEGCHGKFCCS